jgi:hypothetical protein
MADKKPGVMSIRISDEIEASIREQQELTGLQMGDFFALLINEHIDKEEKEQLQIKAPVFAGDVTNLRDLVNQMAVIFNSVGEKAKRLNEMAAIEKATAVDALQAELSTKNTQLETISLENKALQVTVQEFERRIKDLERTLAAEALLADNYKTLKEENKSLKEENIRLTKKLNTINE